MMDAAVLDEGQRSAAALAIVARLAKTEPILFADSGHVFCVLCNARVVSDLSAKSHKLVHGHDCLWLNAVRLMDEKAESI